MAKTNVDFRPQVAEGIFDAWVRRTTSLSAGKPAAIGREGRRCDQGNSLRRRNRRAKVFIDCSYEGDLLAKPAFTYHVGRESNVQYNETDHGVHIRPQESQFQQARRSIREPGVTSGLLNGSSRRRWQAGSR